ncbi:MULTISPECIES: hypothetical protein [unclassified Streptomyces]|uniref:hypothetical protein n=1 Tax=unclassified Streptomyces TaxID=2593676 RepID=UPI0034466FFA
MAGHEKARHHPRTTPSEALGESGDREARQQADDAVVRRSGRGEGEGEADAGGHRAKRHRPGIGREEQIHPDDARQGDSEGR